MIYGTSYFASTTDAYMYYKPYGYDDLRETVDRKIAEGEIHIGAPATPKNGRVFLNSQEGRYFIEENND